MSNWGINSIANWSSREIINMNPKAFYASALWLGIDEGCNGALLDVLCLLDFFTK